MFITKQDTCLLLQDAGQIIKKQEFYTQVVIYDHPKDFLNV